MLIEIPEKFLNENKATEFQKVFVNTQNITLVKADGYNYGNGVEYSMSICLDSGHYIPLAYGINEKMVMEFTHWFNDLIYTKENK